MTLGTGAAGSAPSPGPLAPAICVTSGVGGSATQCVGIAQSGSAKTLPSRCCHVPWKGPAPDQFGHALQCDHTQAWDPGGLVASGHCSDSARAALALPPPK